MVECLPWMREEGSGFNPIHKLKKKKKGKERPDNKENVWTKGERGTQQQIRSHCF